MNTHKWDCRNVEVYTTYTDGEGNTEPLVIFKVNWEILVSDEVGNTTNITGIEELNIRNLDNFTSFDEVTNTQVTEWVKISMGESTVAANELLADEALNTFLNPVTQELMLQD